MAELDLKAEENTRPLCLVEYTNGENYTSDAEKLPGVMEKRNKKGETVLHIAAMNTDFFSKVDLLLNEGADVNATNYWGQTPLHYAAQAKSEKTICRLLQDENIDVSHKDANGYTALHYSVISSKEIDITWSRCLDCLVNGGIDINCTTNTGESVLHQISRLYDENVFLFFFKHILSKYPEINLFLKDLEGKNFIHTWLSLHCFNMGIVKIIVEYQNEKQIKTLLNQKDYSGISSWMKIVEYAFRDIKVINELVLSYGASVNATDNMKNTALHVLSSRGGTEQSFKIMEMLDKLGIDVNAKNIFGQTALSLLEIEDTFDVFSKFKVEWLTRDRWNRTPFFEMLSKRTVHPALLLKMLQKHKDYLQEDDMFQSTPLHVAAYVGYVHKVRFLLKFLEKRNNLDHMGDTAADTALRHGNFECYQLFGRSINFYIPPKTVRLTSFKGKDDIRDVLNYFPKDLKGYSDFLLLTKHISNSEVAENREDTDIILAVNKLVSRICDAVESYDSRFKMLVFKTGSVAEGTKVGQPDEFDFALCMEMLSKNCDIEIPTNQDQHEFVCLRFKENFGREYISFSDENRFFVALPFLNYLFRYLI